MNEQRTPRTRYLVQVLYRYTRALESGDLETVAAILSEAEHDRALERMLLEVNEVYQAADNAVVSPGEIEQVLDMLTALPLGEVNSAERNDGSLEQIALLPPEQKSTQERRSSIMKVRTHKSPSAQEDLINPVPPPTRNRRLSRQVQSLVAVLMVCALLGGFLALFASRHTAPKTPGPSSGEHHSTPTPIATAPVYFVTALSIHGTLYALRPDTGAVLWHFATGRLDANIQMDAILNIQDHVVYLDVLGQVYALQASNGHLLWHRDLGITHPATYDGSGGSLFLDHNMVFVSGFGDAGGSVYALRAGDGTVLWHTQAGWLVLLTESNGILYLDDQNANGGYGDLQAVRGTDGKTLWRYNTPPVSAVVDSGVLYVHSANGTTPGSNKEQKTITALRAQDGKFMWSVPAIDFGANNLVVENGEILLNTTVHFCAFRSSDGAQLWCTRNDLPPEAANVTAYAAMNGTLYASYPTQTSTNSNNSFVRVEAINLSNGMFRWSKDFSNAFNSGSLAVMNGSLYTAVNGTLFALNGANGHDLWQTPPDLEGLVTVVAGLL